MLSIVKTYIYIYISRTLLNRNYFVFVVLILENLKVFVFWFLVRNQWNKSFAFRWQRKDSFNWGRIINNWCIKPASAEDTKGYLLYSNTCSPIPLRNYLKFIEYTLTHHIHFINSRTVELLLLNSFFTFPDINYLIFPH